MASQKGRNLLLKIGNGGGAETFTTIGAARMTSMMLNNQLVDNTNLDSNGLQSVQAGGGVQSLAISLEGLFKDSAAEELLRAAAFNRAAGNYQLLFPNGDMLAATFAVHNYSRGAPFDGLEAFSVVLIRSGSSTFTPGV